MRNPHQGIVAEIDSIEADLYGLYRRLESLRLQLQREWRVLPSGAPWNEAKQASTRFSDRAGGTPEQP